MKRMFYAAAGWLGAVLITFAWHSDGASWREAIQLTLAGIRPISGGAIPATHSAWYTGGRDSNALGGTTAANAGPDNAQSVSVVARWARQVWIELPKLIYWSKFMGEGLNNVIQKKNELENNPGDRIKFDFIRKLFNVGKREGDALEGAEERILSYQDEVVLYQKRNAVRLAGRLSERSTAWDQRTTAKELLTTWMAERIDADIFAAMDTSSTNTLWGGSATSKATIVAGDFMTTALLTKAKTRAKKMGSIARAPGASGGGSAAPDWKIWPVKIGNKEYYICIISPEQEHDLKVHDAAWAQAMREAQVRGDENPLFEGSVGVWDQVIVHVHENIATATDFGAVGANLPGAYALFVGRQAGAFAWGQRPSWVEKEFEYGDQTGFAVGAIYGVTKAVFDAKDNAVVQIGTNRTVV